MADNIDLQLNLDPSGFVQGANQAAAASAGLATNFDRAQHSSGLLGRALSLVTPGRVFSAASVTAAATWQQQMSGIAATSAVTGQSMQRLSAGIGSLARAFPVGNRGAMEIASTLQSMGYSGKDQIGTINDLSKAYVRLGAATGTSASVIGRQMTTLNRAFGLNDNDVKRFTKMGDSLTTVQAKIGGSASDILTFSKSIAPMARSAGIGESAVMGIAGAFSKMGEDGFAASNAMNKMLTDLNRSVRDGSSEMGTYANIVGKTRKEFEALFKADPTKAISLLTSSLGKGPGAERNLERIGLDGVRTSRVFQALSQQGGIEAAASTAVAGYGSNNTKKAADAAENSLVNAFTKLSSATEQVTMALGTPFLGALTHVVDFAAAPVRATAAVTSNHYAQDIIKFAVPAVLAYMAARSVGAFGLGSATVRQLTLNNGVSRGFSEGNQQGFLGLQGPAGPMTEAQESGRLGNLGFYGKASDFSIRAGRGFGQARAAWRAERTGAAYRRYVGQGMDSQEAYDKAMTPGPSIASQVGQGLRNLPRTLTLGAFQAQRAYNKMMQEAYQAQKEEDPTFRRQRSPFRFQREEHLLAPGVAGPQGPATGNVGRFAEGFRAASRSRDFNPETGKNDIAVGMTQRAARMGGLLRESAGQAISASSTLGNAMKMVRNSIENTAIGVAAAGQTLGAANKRLNFTGGLKNIASSLINPYAIATGVGLSSLNYLREQQGQRNSQADRIANGSITGTMDAYRDSVSRATDSVQTFAQQVRSANGAMATSATTEGQARGISTADEAYARDTRNNVVRRYRGSNSQIAATINAASGGKLDPTDLNAVKLDLRRQFGKDRAQTILNQLGGTTGTDASGNAVNPMDFNSILGGAVGKDNSGTSLMKRFQRSILGQDGSTGGGIQSVAGSLIGRFDGGKGLVGLAGLLGIGGGEVGGRFNNYSISKNQGQAVAAVGEAIGQDYSHNSDNYGADYAKQQQAREANAAFKAAQATNNKDLIAATSQQLTIQLGGKDNQANITADDAKKAGGFVQAYMKQNKFARGDLAGVELDPNKGLKAELTDSALTKATKGIDLFGEAMSNNAEATKTGLNKLTDAFLKAPGDMQKFRDAVGGYTAEGAKTGRSLGQVGDAALKTVAALNDSTSDASKLAQAVFQRAFSDSQAQAGFVGPGKAAGNNIGFYKSMISSASNSPEGQQQLEQGRAGYLGEQENLRAQLTARLQMQRQFQISSRRANEDYQQQLTYSNADFTKQEFRAEQDRQTQLARSHRDFGIQEAQAQEDFQLSRKRANEDFNKSIKRANEDAAKAMYDPYKRMQVQAVSDLGTLTGNLAEQNQALERQTKNLDALRKAGVNNSVIDQLGLNKSENAQQLDRILGDIQTGGKGAADDLNATIARRMKDAGALASDSSQVDRKRGKEDFTQSLERQDVDFAKTIKRNRQAYARSLADMEFDYKRGLARMNSDFQEQLARQKKAFDLSLTRQQADIIESQKVILGSLDKLADAVQQAMAGKAVSFKDLMHNTLADAVASARGALAAVDSLVQKGQSDAPIIDPSTTLGNADRNIAPKKDQKVTATGGFNLRNVNKGNTTSLIDDLAGMAGTQGLKISSVNTGNHADTSYHYKDQAIDFSGPRVEMDKLADYLLGLNYSGKAHITELIHQDSTTKYRWGIKDGQKFNYDKALFDEHEDHVHVAISAKDAAYIASHFSGVSGNSAPRVTAGGMAKGGIVTAPVVSWVGEGGSHEAVIPLNNQGVAVLARAMTQFMTGPDIMRMTTGSKGDRVTYTGNTFIQDHSTRVSGPITVQAQDPNAMMRALQAKARQANLTATPTRKG